MFAKSSNPWWRGIAAVLAALLLQGCPRPEPDTSEASLAHVDSCASSPAVSPSATLPIFRLDSPDSAAGVARLGALGSLVGLTGPPRLRDGRVALENDTLSLEVYLASNAVWFEDRAWLWNLDARPTLAPPALARFRARSLLAQPAFALEAPFHFVESMGRTVMVRFDRRMGRIAETNLDLQLDYQVRVRVDGVGDLPVAGGGGKLEVVLGDTGRVIGFSSFWRATKGVDRNARLIPRASADESFLEGTERLNLISCTSELAYYAAPPSVRQDYLYPVWLYSAVGLADGDTVHYREVVVPATDFAPPEPAAAPPAVSGSAVPIPDPDREDGGGGRLEGGTAWIDAKLPHARENTRGFVEGLAASGGTVVFDHGPGKAARSDWIEDDDDVVDRVDLVFYTGHADRNGWSLDNGNVATRLIGSLRQNPPDHWGNRDLEWILIGACGPLQDIAIGTSRSGVFDRWGGAFDGLHMLLGFGSDSRDTPEEGRTLTRYALEGRTLLNAWLRAARETQPSTIKRQPVWAGALFPYKGTAHAGNDHLWGRGSVSVDIRDPEGFIAIWSTV